MTQDPDLERRAFVMSYAIAAVKSGRLSVREFQVAMHAPAICPKDLRTLDYVGKGYRAKFTCPECGRAAYQHLNFLGRRNLICNGKKFMKAAR